VSSSTAPRSLIGNRLLAALPSPEYQRLIPHLKSVALTTAELLYEPGDQIHFIYFPVTAIVSLVSVTSDGASIELGVIGNEGMVGLPILLGVDSTTFAATVLVSGHALRMKTEILKREFNRCGPLLNLLLRHTHAQVVQMSQSAVCNALHTVEERLCRWLLLTHDRVRTEELQITHESLSNMIGTRRSSITQAASKLKQRGLIEYHRGKIQVVDRKGLESCACECYGVVKQEYERLHRK